MRFSPLLADAARFARHAPGDRWYIDETYIRVNGVWRCVDAVAARRFFRRALSALKVVPTEVLTDAAPVYPAVLDELVPQTWHHVERHANNPIEADHSQLKHRLRPMRGLRTDRTAQVVISGHSFIKNLRRGHYELGTETPSVERIAAAFTELARTI